MVWKRCVVSVTVLCMVSCMGRFYSKQRIDRERLEEHPTYTIYTATTDDGEVFEFEPSAVLQDSLIRGELKDGSLVEIPISHVHSVYVRKLDDMKVLAGCAGATLGLIIGLGLLFYLAAREHAKT